MLALCLIITLNTSTRNQNIKDQTNGDLIWWAKKLRSNQSIIGSTNTSSSNLPWNLTNSKSQELEGTTWVFLLSNRIMRHMKRPIKLFWWRLTTSGGLLASEGRDLDLRKGPSTNRTRRLGRGITRKWGKEREAKKNIVKATAWSSNS